MIWQPIETAPKDGRIVLLRVKTYSPVWDKAANVKHRSLPMAGNWDERTGCWLVWNHDGAGGLCDDVSHWMPLPEGPK